ncbi:hypothetical protein [Kitasatospora viridis]|uniref:Uncharacterized protein n=1 Tax=Kitasatospora viridis TaxID=281105 RepID=A0A561SFF0_9ACTN|nr:hypothetical protein [Kitasatospora viridis]TWF73603.1 hypothetical protein FHX73_15216 [Kitasatospora viridis]
MVNPPTEPAVPTTEVAGDTEPWTSTGPLRLRCLLPLRPDAALTVHQHEPENDPW